MNQNRYDILQDIITGKVVRTHRDHCGNVCCAMYSLQKRRTYPYSLPELVCYKLGIDMMGTKIRKNFIKDKIKPRLRELIAKGGN